MFNQRETLLPAFAALLLIGLGLVSGCTTVEGRVALDEQGNPSELQFAVRRALSDAQIEGLKITRDNEDGFTLDLTGYKSEAEQIAEAVSKGVSAGVAEGLSP